MALGAVSAIDKALRTAQALRAAQAARAAPAAGTVTGGTAQAIRPTPFSPAGAIQPTPFVPASVGANSPGSFTAPGVHSVDRTRGVLGNVANRVRGVAGNALNSARGVTGALGRAASTPINTPTTRVLGGFGRGARAVGGFGLRAATGPLAAITTAAAAGNAFSKTEMGERARQPFTDMLARLTGLDDQQNQMLSNDPAISGAAVDEFRAPQPRPELGEIVPQGQRVTPEQLVTADGGAVGAAPENTIRTADGRVMRAPVDSEGRTLPNTVNTMSPENFTRIGSGLSQRLSDARMAAAERGDFGQLETDRAAFDGQRDTNRQIMADFEREQAMSLLGRSGGDIRRRLRPMSNPESSLARTAMASLGQLETGADRAAGLETAQINANARREPAQDPLMSPSVIAERLRQDGADRRATGPDLFQGLEPLEDVTGNVTGFQGVDSQGTPVVVPVSRLAQASKDYQRLRQSGDVPPDMNFLDWFSRILSDDTAQG